MNAPIDQQQLRAMSVSERLRLLEDVWSSLADNPEALAVPEWHRAELDARRAAHRDDPDAARDWAEIREELRHDRGE
jgi:putative addiction module component (TIGR02574 family)